MSRKIYFAGSIHGGRQDAELYFRIIEQLKGYGTVFTEHVGHPNHPELAGMNEKEVHDGHIDDWLQKSDVLVAECTQPSLGVGYEIGRAVAMNKNIFVLFRPDAGRR
nr:hypothetical protein BaRGS_021983 [Batillaria attramentaria]